MSHLFLLNSAIELPDLSTFKGGMSEIIVIDKKNGHRFWKHESVYRLNIYEQLCMSCGQEEQAIILYIEQLTSCPEKIDTEAKADDFCKSSMNGFLGVNFENTNISPTKRISNNLSYQAWCYNGLSNFDKLQHEIEHLVVARSFERAFENLTVDSQEAIIEGFVKAKKRGLKTPYYPDTKLIKEVTPDKAKHTVLELRIFAPVALRIFFHESKGCCYIATIGLKSSGDQNQDIKQAHKLIDEMLKENS